MITALGMGHSVVTRNTSLIVPDRIEDYIAYKIVPTFSVGMDLGYRLASVSQMTANADDTNTGVKSGDAIKDFLTNTVVIPFDFGGVKIGARASFSF